MKSKEWIEAVVGRGPRESPNPRGFLTKLNGFVDELRYPSDVVDFDGTPYFSPNQLEQLAEISAAANALQGAIALVLQQGVGDEREYGEIKENPSDRALSEECEAGWHDPVDSDELVHWPRGYCPGYEIVGAGRAERTVHCSCPCHKRRYA